MAEKRHRSTKEEALKTKLAKNAEKREKLKEKIKALDEADASYKQQLLDLNDTKKKEARAAEAKAKREEMKKKEKELMAIIEKSGLSVEEALDKLKA
ncbi:MAG: hypothetical protein Q4C03_06170 [bacterium]|nr:hypothetical protein [bacterium]